MYRYTGARRSSNVMVSLWLNVIQSNYLRQQTLLRAGYRKWVQVGTPSTSDLIQYSFGGCKFSQMSTRCLRGRFPCVALFSDRFPIITKMLVSFTIHVFIVTVVVVVVAFVVVNSTQNTIHIFWCESNCKLHNIRNGNRLFRWKTHKEKPRLFSQNDASSGLSVTGKKCPE